MLNDQQKLSFFEYILTHRRGLFVIIFLLPLSVLYNLYFSLLNQISFLLASAPEKHNERVQKIIDEIAQWKKNGAKQKLCTARSPWLAMSELVPQYKTVRKNVEVNLQDVLEIDVVRKIVRVEPLLNMGRLTATLIPLGWTLPVVPELDDLTVGGLIMGFGIESSSHKYGLFQYICEAYEIVTADGKLLRCSENENTDLFYQIPWSHGTLGILVAAELRIIPAKKFVRIKYQPLFGLQNIVSNFEKASRNTSNDFVECIQYSRDKAILMTANFADIANGDGILNHQGRWYKSWFYKHCENYLNIPGGGVEYIPLRHYYHRHTRSLFWEMGDIISFGNHRLFRLLLGWALPPRISLLKYFETETTKNLREKYHVVQDMLVPIMKLKESLLYFDEHFCIYPLWLSPMCIYRNKLDAGFIRPYKSPNGEIDELFVDIGAYGTPQIANFDSSQALRGLEQFVLNNKGYQALYARTLLSRKDFREMFDHTSYDILRQKMPFCQEAFGEVYEKISARMAPAQFKKTSSGKT